MKVGTWAWVVKARLKRTELWGTVGEIPGKVSGSADEDVGLLFCPVDSGRPPPTPGHCNVSGQ